ncbi:DUF2786 domain-containing protein [Myxococcota bacterium]|nr:DUF2786 domain-containing protein [Myxococcota bacterium]
MPSSPAPASSSAASSAAQAAVDRIRKLLALAADQQGTPEGQAAARLARRLIHRYDLAGQALHEPAGDPIVRVALAIDGRVLWRRRLAAAVARHCECALSWSPSEQRAWLYGRHSGVAVAQYLHAVLRREIEDARRRYDEELPMMTGEKERARLARDFTGSAVLAVENRLAALRGEEAAVRPDQCAVVSRRGQELREWMQAQGVHFHRQAPSVFAYSAEGYAAGHAITLRDAVRGQALDPARSLRS